MEESATYRHLLGKALDAHRGGKDAWWAMSTGERLAVAFVLNKPEWIQEMGYTLVDAVSRIGSEWMQLMPYVVKDVQFLSDQTR